MAEALVGRMALLVLDTQNNMFDEEFCVHNPGAILGRIEHLISLARESDAPILFVRNNGGQEEPDEPGTAGWEIHPCIRPQSEDYVIDKSSPDAFAGTDLADLLKALGVVELVITGMQTELCVRATSLAALQRGYKVRLVEDAHTTFDFNDRTALESIEALNEELRSIASVAPSSRISF